MTFREEAWNYVRYAVAPLLPGRRVPVFDTNKNEPHALDGWSDDELLLMVDEGRRQLDRQAASHGRLLDQAQFLFTTSLALLVVVSATLRRIHDDEGHWALVAAWLCGTVLVFSGTLGAASLLSVRAAFGSIDSALLSQSEPPVLRDLADAYASFGKPGDDTLNTRITVYRDAVLLVLVGAALHSLAWVSTVLGWLD